MCIYLGELRWRYWNPDEEYLEKISGIKTITKLINFMKDFEYKWDIATIFGREIPWDSWQMPDISLKTMQGDCEDAAILAVDILGRVIGKTDSMVLIIAGQYREDNKVKTNAHAVTVVPDNAKLQFDVISNNQYFTGYKTIEDIGRKWYPVNLIYQKLFDWRGRRL